MISTISRTNYTRKNLLTVWLDFSYKRTPDKVLYVFSVEGLCSLFFSELTGTVVDNKGSNIIVHHFLCLVEQSPSFKNKSFESVCDSTPVFTVNIKSLGGGALPVSFHIW